jgi:hypothetical protein
MLLGKEIKKSNLKKKGKDGDENDDQWEDVDEHEQDVFDRDGYFEVMDEERMISNADIKLLEKLNESKIAYNPAN